MTTKRYTELENGLRVLTERVDHVETVSLGIWLDCGSRHESERENGMFHFIEHTLFKGTPTRTARCIAEEVDGVGGILDAYTAKEETCYSLKVREKFFPKLLNTLSDMLQNPRFDPIELDHERGVVLEEIKMEEDNPEDLVFEKAMQGFWSGHALARPILGNPENILQFSQDELLAFHQRFYRTENMLVVAAGRVDHDTLCQQLITLFPNRRASLPNPGMDLPIAKAFQHTISRPYLEQINFNLVFKGLPQADPHREALTLLATLLGGSMSSRLFQKIREEEGLAYNVGAFTQSNSDSGLFSIYGGCSPKHFEQVINLCLEELRDLCKYGVTNEELIRAKEQFIGSLAMSLESTQSRTSWLARWMLYQKRIFDLDQTIAELEKVSPEAVQALAKEIFDDRWLGICAIGRFDSKTPSQTWSLSQEFPV